MATYKVEIDYFKQTGKWYSGGSYISNQKELFQIWDELREMFKEGKRPGLIDGAMGFLAVVNVPNHPHRHPHLILPIKLSVNKTTHSNLLDQYHSLQETIFSKVRFLMKETETPGFFVGPNNILVSKNYIETCCRNLEKRLENQPVIEHEISGCVLHGGASE